MLVWGFAPTSNLDVLFWILAINRVLSGLAEAAASGADEALVYDSIDEAGKKDEWGLILQKVTRWQLLRLHGRPSDRWHFVRSRCHDQSLRVSRVRSFTDPAGNHLAAAHLHQSGHRPTHSSCRLISSGDSKLPVQHRSNFYQIRFCSNLESRLLDPPDPFRSHCNPCRRHH